MGFFKKKYVDFQETKNELWFEWKCPFCDENNVIVQDELISGEEEFNCELCEDTFKLSVNMDHME